jgi:DnaK suppressor protein
MLPIRFTLRALRGLFGCGKINAPSALYKQFDLIIGPSKQSVQIAAPDGEKESRMAGHPVDTHGRGEDYLSAMPDNDSEYRPSDDEPFMNAMQIEYFRSKLTRWKESILKESAETLNTLQNEPLREPDLTDRASSETDWSIELRTRDRQRKLISKIEAALRRIEEGEYGYCEVTGDAISLGRLEARPIATMTLEAQEAHERQEKVSRDE